MLVALVYLALFVAFGAWTLSVGLDVYQRRTDSAMVDFALALASQVDMDAHERIREDSQTGSVEYTRLLAPLEKMHLGMHEVRGVYTKRIDDDGDMVYVLDTAQSRIPELRERATAVTRVGERVLMYTIEPELVATVLSGKPWVDAESFLEGNVLLRGIYVPLRAAGGKVVGMLGMDFEESELRAIAAQWGWGLVLPAVVSLGLVSGLLGALVWLLRNELGIILAALREETIRDSLTGMFNRRHFNHSLARHVELAQHTGRSISLVMIDVDKFKSINDTLGHASGDRVLMMVAEALAQCARSEDIACRIGGEEFALILPGTDQRQSQVLFSRVAGMIRRPLGQSGDVGLALSVSAGIASLIPGEDAEGLMLRADRALYGAKRSGRDCVELAMPEGGTA